MQLSPIFEYNIYIYTKQECALPLCISRDRRGGLGMLQLIVRLQISLSSERNGALFAGVLSFVGVLSQMQTQRWLLKEFTA